MVKAIIFDWGGTLWDHETKAVFPAVPELLATLSKKYRLAIVSLASDGDVARRRREVTRAGIEKFFASILVVPVNKDKAYDVTFEKLKLKPAETILVDDRVVRGIAYGNRIGAKTIWLKRGKFSHELPNEQTGEPTYTIANINDLVGAIEKAEVVRIESGSDLIEGGCAKRYDLFMGVLTGTGLYSKMVNLIKLGPGQQLLDVGCGTGSLLFKLFERYGSSAGLFGMDLSRDMLSLAEEKKKKKHAMTVQFMIGGAENLEIKDEAFDVVTSSLALHHLPPEQQRVALEEIYRVLKPGGRVFIADFGRPLNWMGRVTASWMQNHSYVKHTMGGSLIAFMKAAGFKNITTLDRHRTLIEIWHAIK